MRQIDTALGRAFGRDRIESLAAHGSSTFRRKPLSDDPLLRIVVGDRGHVAVLPDDFEDLLEHDSEWESIVESESIVATVANPHVLDVHGGGDWVHCFSLGGDGGIATFSALDDQAVDSTGIARWLGSLHHLFGTD